MHASILVVLAAGADRSARLTLSVLPGWRCPFSPLALTVLHG